MPFKLKLTLILTLLTVSVSAQTLRGIVVDNENNPLAYANVYEKNTTNGSTTNQKGEFKLDLSPGKHTLVFSYVGYEQLEKEVFIQKGQNQSIIVVLKGKTLQQVEIVSDNRDMAKAIMKNVRDKRSFYLDKVQGYTCETYTKISVRREPLKIDSIDTIPNIDTTKITKDKPWKKLKFWKSRKTREELDSLETLRIKRVIERNKVRNVNLIESYVKTNYSYPGKYKEEVLAYDDHKVERTWNSTSVSVGIEMGPKDIGQATIGHSDPYVVYRDISSCDFNFYNNIIEFPSLVQKPLLSPLASTSALNYTFLFVGSSMQNGRKIYEIKVKPIFRQDALFEGSIFIEDSTWALTSVDLQINPGALFFCKEFKIKQEYIEPDSGIYVPSKRDINYTIKDGSDVYFGNTFIEHSNYSINPVFPRKFFNEEIQVFAVDAFDRDSAFWASTRINALNNNEMKYIKLNDSLNNYYASDEYYAKIDSIYNRITFWFWLNGVGHINRKNGTKWYIEGLFNQLNPYGIGGYRHKLPGNFSLDFKNDMTLETWGFVDYGFANKDVKAKVAVGLTYLPLKFVRTSLEFGDYYDMINDYASISQIFSRSNYVRTKSYSISQRMEIVNGLYGELTLKFSDQIPLKGLIMDKWSAYLFDTLNNPAEFNRYKKAEMRLELKYRIKQKYVVKRKKKIVLGTDYPEINLVYRKGLFGIFGSEVNFDYLELGARGDLKLARFGLSRWEIQAGSFVNKRHLRVLEYKHFRGSDPYLFSDPIHSLQLMGPTFHTPNSYLRANYIHHFYGAFTDQIPLLNWLKISLAAGGGTMLIPSHDFEHIEVFGGIEKIIRIKKQLFRLGVYAVTSGNTYEKGQFSFKIGLDFFNTFSQKWNY